MNQMERTSVRQQTTVASDGKNEGRGYKALSLLPVGDDVCPVGIIAIQCRHELSGRHRDVVDESRGESVRDYETSARFATERLPAIARIAVVFLDDCRVH